MSKSCFGEIEIMIKKDSIASVFQRICEFLRTPILLTSLGGCSSSRQLNHLKDSFFEELLFIVAKVSILYLL